MTGKTAKKVSSIAPGAEPTPKKSRERKNFFYVAERIAGEFKTAREAEAWLNAHKDGKDFFVILGREIPVRTGGVRIDA